MITSVALPITFLGYALETTANILSLLATKKVELTRFEMWNGKPHSHAYFKIWHCKVLVCREESDKLEPRSKRCYFVEYPQNTFGHIF